MGVKVRTLALAAIALGCAFTVHDARANLDAVASTVKPFLIRIESDLSKCPGGGKDDGWGLAVGEDATSVYVATARHVVFSRRDGKCPASELKLSWSQGVALRTTLPFPANILPIPPEFQEVDVAFFKFAKPRVWRTVPPTIAWVSILGRGEGITYLGYKARATTPFDSGRVLEACEAIGKTGLCNVIIDGISTTAGDSGAPLLSAGGVLGLVNSEGQSLSGIRIDSVRRVAQAARIPWTLLTESEQKGLGLALNAALLTGDAGRANQLLDRRFNSDMEFGAGTDRYPETPISMAVRYGHLAVASRLIAAGVQDTRMAAAVAANDGKTQVLVELIANKGDIGCALAIGMRMKREDVVQLILARASKEQIGVDYLCMEMSLLYWATLRGYHDAATKLLDLGADPNRGHGDVHFNRGNPLTNVILRQNWTLVDRMLAAGARSDVIEYPQDARDYGAAPYLEIFGPLHAAAATGNIALMDRLIRQGANPDAHSTAKHGSTVVGGSPFEAAMLSGHIAAARHLRNQYKVSPLGYRYRDNLIRDLRGRDTLTSSYKVEAEMYVLAEAKEYCKMVRKENFSNDRDFYNQDAKCRP